MINPVLAPEGIDEAGIRRRLLNEYGIELGGGLGALKGKAWRIGLMGQSSNKDHVMLCLSALEQTLLAEGHTIKESGVTAASEVYRD